MGKGGWGGKGGNIFCPKLIELSGFSPYQRALISCHIFDCMCFYIRLWQQCFTQWVCAGGYDHIKKPIHILIYVDAKNSPLFKVIHNKVAECWFHTLIFIEYYQSVQCTLSETQGSHHKQHMGVTQTANTANISGCGDLTFPFCNIYSELWRADLKLYFGISISVTFPALNSAVRNNTAEKQWTKKSRIHLKQLMKWMY